MCRCACSAQARDIPVYTLDTQSYADTASNCSCQNFTATSLVTCVNRQMDRLGMMFLEVVLSLVK